MNGFVWQCIFQKRIIDTFNIRFKDKLKFGEDLNFLLEYLLHSKSIQIVENVGYKYYINNQSETNRYRKNCWDELKNTYIENMCLIGKEEVFGHILYVYGVYSLKHYASNSYYSTAKYHIHNILNDKMFQKSLAQINFHRWGWDERILNRCIIYKCDILVYAYFRYFLKIVNRIRT